MINDSLKQRAGVCAYSIVVLSRGKALTFSNKGLLLLVGDYPIRQLVLYEKDFGWITLWELNPQVLGSLWLIASATWGGGGNHFG
jgi:hypothetical protein